MGFVQLWLHWLWWWSVFKRCSHRSIDVQWIRVGVARSRRWIAPPEVGILAILRLIGSGGIGTRWRHTIGCIRSWDFSVSCTVVSAWCHVLMLKEVAFRQSKRTRVCCHGALVVRGVRRLSDEWHWLAGGLRIEWRRRIGCTGRIVMLLPFNQVGSSATRRNPV